MDTESFLVRRREIEDRMEQRRSYEMPRWSRMIYSFLSGIGLNQVLSGVVLPLAGSVFMNKFGRRSLDFVAKKPFLTRIFNLLSLLKA